MKPILGFVGIGNIGEPVCRKLLEGGYELLIYDVDPEALELLRYVRRARRRCILWPPGPTWFSCRFRTQISSRRSSPVRADWQMGSREARPDRHFQFGALFDAEHREEACGQRDRHARRPGQRWCPAR